MTALAPAGGWDDDYHLEVSSFQAGLHRRAQQLVGLPRCEAQDLIARARTEGWELDAQRIDCPVRVVWGTEDQLLPWPRTAARYRNEWLPAADYVELDGVGHCPQLDVPLETAQLILGFAQP